MEGKADLRRTMREWRDHLAPEARSAAAAAIAAHLRRYEPYRCARTVLAYWTMGSEVPTEALIAAALRGRKVVCLPQIVAAERRLVPRRILDPVSDLVAGYRGILEPDPARTPQVGLSRLDLVLVPGLAFTRQGARLGYGEGYFDRFLATLPARVWRVALAYAGQVTDRVPADPWDVPMHAIVTPDGVIECGRPAAAG